MKKITFLFCLLFAFSQISAQVWTINSCSAELGSNLYGPMSSVASANATSRTAVVYPAAQLSTLSGQLLTNMYFKRITASGVMAGTPNFKIYLKEVSNADWGATSLDWATAITGATLVYNSDPAAIIGNAAGWKSFPLSGSFTYSGTQNLAVFTEYQNTTASSSITWSYEYSNTCITTTNSNTTKYSNNTTGTYPATLGSTNFRRPLIGFDFPVSCPAPSALTATGATVNSVNLGWVSNGTETEWAYVVQPQGTGAPTGSGVVMSTNPFTVSGLNSSTNYEVYIRANCGVGDSSFWIGPINFSTLCAPITTFPHFEPFNTFLPNNCWSNGLNGDLTSGPATFTASGWGADGLANVGTTGAIRNNIYTVGANDWVISPEFSIPATGYELKFDAAAVQFAGTGAPTTPWEADDSIEVLVSTTGTTNWTPLHVYNNTNQPGITATPLVLDLDAFATQTVRFAFRAIEGAADGGADIDFSIDNFQVRLSPTCPDQTGLVVSGVTGSGANTSWDNLSGSGSIGYEYAITTSVTPPASGTATTSTFYIATGLLPQTVYYLHVRSECAGSTYGNWSTTTFTTGCAPITVLPHVEPFATFLPNCWSEADNGDLIAGPLTSGSGSWLVDGFGNVGTTGAIRVTLDAATDNDWVLSPEFTIPATGYELKFIAAANQGGSTNAPTTPWESDDFVEVLVTTTNNTNWTPLFTYTNINVPLNTGSINVLDLDAYSGQTVRFAFRAVEGATNGTASVDFSVDNFEVRLSPPCADQTGLVVSGITGSGANTSWDDMSGTGAIGYEYAVTTSATPPASGTATASTFYIATGLLPQTVYYLHVRTECSGSLYGAWSTTTFTTGCAPITVLPHLEPFDTFLPNCWSEADNGDLIAGPLTPGSGSWLVDGFGNVGTTGAIRVTLDAATDNDWVLSPEFTIPATGYELKFIAAANQSGSTNAPTTPWESDDFVEVLVTTTNNTNWTPLFTYTNTNVPLNTGSINVLDLDAYSGQTVRFAFRAVEGATNGTAIVDFSVDNFEVRLTPPCADQTGLVVSGITGSGANTSWDDMSGTGAIGYEYAVTTSATPPASGTATASTFYIATGLLPQTVYYLHVRTECSGSVYGAWSTVTFTTACAPLVTLPWLENFDALTPGTNVFPTCWNYFNTTSTWSISTSPVAYSGANSLRRTWSTDGWAFTPMFSLTAGTSYTFSYYVRTNDATVGYDVTVGVGNAQDSAAMTTTLSSVVGYQGVAWTLVSLEYTPSVSGDYSFGVRVVAPFAPNGINFDDFELKLTPACPAPLASTSNITSISADLTWAAVPSATLGYEYVLDNVATDPVGAGTSILATTYAASGLTQLTTYYFHIRSACSAGTFSTWSTVSFTTLATPPVNDNLCNATALTIGTPTGLTNTLVGATAQASEPVSTCFNGGINGSVWFSFVAPASGSAEVSTDFSGGTLQDGDTEIAVYAGTGVTCANLTTLGTALGCDQDGGTTVSFSSFLSLTGLTPGDTYYVQVDRWGTVTPGTFGIQVTEVLSSNSFDTTSFVAYPNPVKDVLNLSYKTAISNVRIINLLGQEVLNTKANTNDVQVNMSALTAGAYIVNITVEDTVHTIKVIKE
jgi:hypothetical protein